MGDDETELGEMDPLFEASVHLHVMFEKLTSAGFTENQALKLVSDMLIYGAEADPT